MSDKLKLFLENDTAPGGLPDHDYLFSVADSAASVLENEICSYRPASDFNTLGGLLDFSGGEKLPLVIVPDLHARSYFLRNILNFTLPESFSCSEINGGKTGISVFQALEEDKIRLVFVGDLLHSELRGRLRWMEALKDFDRGNYNGESMTAEMSEGLTLLSMIMELKIAFPANVHILKGNHENIMNVRGPGDFPFRKFANEGEMVKDFMVSVYGDDVLMVISCFEKNLPLAAVFPECVVSHAEPARAFSRQELINGMDSDEVILGLTWTENNAAKDGSVKKMLESLTEKPDSLYFGGHRPIQGNYSLRQNGKYVQIHNPDRQNIVLVYKDRPIDLDANIVQVDKAII